MCVSRPEKGGVVSNWHVVNRRESKLMDCVYSAGHTSKKSMGIKIGHRVEKEGQFQQERLVGWIWDRSYP